MKNAHRNAADFCITSEELLDCSSEALYSLFGVNPNNHDTVEVSISEQIQLCEQIFELTVLDDSDGVWASSANADTIVSRRR